MNRRTFLTGSAAAAAFLTTRNPVAQEIDILQSPVLEMLRNLPDRSAADGFDFMITHATNNTLQRSVIPENLDRYWEPISEDYQIIFGISRSSKDLSGKQDGVSLWKMDTNLYQWESTLQTLESNGWELVDEDLHLLHYAGSDEDRRELAASLKQLNEIVLDDTWDWIALPRADTIVIGASESLIHSIADHTKHYTGMQTVNQNFLHIRYILHIDTYEMSLLPRQALPVESTEASFISRAWIGDAPIIQSVGLNLDSPNSIEPILEAVHERLESETSTITGLPYAEFLTIEGTTDYRNALRIDFVDSTGEWDIRHALDAGDLKMLPIT